MADRPRFTYLETPLGQIHCAQAGDLAAARYPERVDRLVLSSTAWVDGASREHRKDRPPIDRVEAQPDGSHRVELWQRRQSLYPPDRPDVLERFVHELEGDRR